MQDIKPNHQTLSLSGSRPALHMVEEDQLKNLDRVLTMNWQTVQQREKRGSEIDQISMNAEPTINPYLLMNPNFSLGEQPAVTPPFVQPQPISQPRSFPVPTQQPSAGPVFVTVPFWTGCPLPFPPASYPQIILPQNLRQPIQNPLGPQILRPPMQLPVVTAQLPAQTTPNVPESEMLQDTDPANAKEEALSKYRQKRSKRKWSRPPNPVLSKIASARARDENGKFIKIDTSQVSNYEKQLQDLQGKLKVSEHESMLLREKLNAVERELARIKNSPRPAQTDDMYMRTLFRNQVEASVPGFSAQLPPSDPAVNSDPSLPYNPFQPGNVTSEAFREKIDLNQKRQDLRQINSPFYSDFKDALETSWDTLERLLGESDAGVMEL